MCRCVLISFLLHYFLSKFLLDCQHLFLLDTELFFPRILKFVLCKNILYKFLLHPQILLHLRKYLFIFNTFFTMIILYYTFPPKKDIPHISIGGMLWGGSHICNFVKLTGLLMIDDGYQLFL